MYFLYCVEKKIEIENKYLSEIYVNVSNIQSNIYNNGEIQDITKAYNEMNRLSQIVSFENHICNYNNFVDKYFKDQTTIMNKIIDAINKILERKENQIDNFYPYCNGYEERDFKKLSQQIYDLEVTKKIFQTKLDLNTLENLHLIDLIILYHNLNIMQDLIKTRELNEVRKSLYKEQNPFFQIECIIQYYVGKKEYEILKISDFNLDITQQQIEDIYKKSDIKQNIYAKNFEKTLKDV